MNGGNERTKKNHSPPLCTIFPDRLRDFDVTPEEFLERSLHVVSWVPTVEAAFLAPGLRDGPLSRHFGQDAEDEQGGPGREVLHVRLKVSVRCRRPGQRQLCPYGRCFRHRAEIVSDQGAS